MEAEHERHAEHKAAIAEALFPAFEEFLTSDNFDFVPPVPLRDVRFSQSCFSLQPILTSLFPASRYYPLVYHGSESNQRKVRQVQFEVTVENICIFKR